MSLVDLAKPRQVFQSLALRASKIVLKVISWTSDFCWEHSEFYFFDWPRQLCLKSSCKAEKPGKKCERSQARTKCKASGPRNILRNTILWLLSWYSLLSRSPNQSSKTKRLSCLISCALPRRLHLFSWFWLVLSTVCLLWFSREISLVSVLRQSIEHYSKLSVFLLLGPQCYVKPSGKSNRKIIVNAISYVCLSGTVNQDQKEKCLQVC